MSKSVLVAGVGNIFLGDDAFGVEVARRLSGDADFPDGVQVADFGIRGVHLAYELLDGYDGLILVDTVSRGEEPGTVYVIEPDIPENVPEFGAGAMDAHGMDPEVVFTTLATLGGRLDHALVVGCEPANVDEGIGLSEPVRDAVEEAARTVRDILAEWALQPAAAGDKTGNTGR